MVIRPGQEEQREGSGQAAGAAQGREERCQTVREGDDRSDEAPARAGAPHRVAA